MNLFYRFFGKVSANVIALNILHIFNDGFEAGIVLLLPFVVRDLHINLTQVGILGSLIDVFGIVLAFPAAYIATKIGGLRTLILAIFVYGLGFVGTGFSTNYILLVCMFSLVGIGTGIFHPIGFSLIARWSDKETRGQAMGSFTAIGDLGRIGISAFLTFVVVYVGWKITAAAYGLMALIIAIACYFTFLANRELVEGKEQTKASITLWELVKNKRYIFAITTNFFDLFASTSLYIFLPFLLLKRGVNPVLLGSFTAAFFVGNFVGKTFLGKLTDKIGNTRVFIISDILMALFTFALANTSIVFIILFCAIILGVFTKGTVPVAQTMISESVEHHGNFEKAFGFNGLFAGASITIAPLILGIVSDKFGIIMAFNVMAVVAIIATIPAFGFHLAKPKHTATKSI